MKFVNPKDNLVFKPAEKALLKAYWRQGLSEVRNTLYQESKIAADVDYGIWGRSTPGEVSQERAEQEPKNLLQAEQEKLRQQLATEPKLDKGMEK
jgi:hypothetical protein